MLRTDLISTIFRNATSLNLVTQLLDHHSLLCCSAIRYSGTTPPPINRRHSHVPQPWRHQRQLSFAAPSGSMSNDDNLNTETNNINILNLSPTTIIQNSTRRQRHSRMDANQRRTSIRHEHKPSSSKESLKLSLHLPALLHCGAKFWESEKNLRSGYGGLPVYNRCCNGGRVVLRAPPEYPEYIKRLYADAHFMENIKAYNQMFSMTSLGANVDSSINNGKGPYVFRISGQIYHWIGSICPEEGNTPRFLQLYIYDTTNEVSHEWPISRVKTKVVWKERSWKVL
ncbi:hypothetical protein Tco_0959724 [Tanacetum coccineum]